MDRTVHGDAELDTTEQRALKHSTWHIVFRP